MRFHLTKLAVCTAALLMFACQDMATKPAESSNSVKKLNQLASVQLEVATTQAQHEVGLMNRTSMPANAGMLFVFDEAKPYCFWMKNTKIPLTVGFLDDRGVLVQTEDMAPETLNTHCAKTPVRYAIEMNLDWFKNQHVDIGTPLIQAPK